MIPHDDEPPPGARQDVRASDGSEIIQVAQGDYVKYENNLPGDALSRLSSAAHPMLKYTLMRDVPYFVPRKELNELLAFIDTRCAVRVYVLSGMPGVGKSALATHVAHQLAERFPDRLFHVSLGAHTPGRTAAKATDVLAALLARLGIAPEHLPDTVEERSCLWRSRLHGKRVLLILDGAAGSEQIEPLLPSSPDCLTLVTSRRRLSALDGVQSLVLDVLSPGQAVSLFAKNANRTIRKTDTRAVKSIVKRCGHLPLAIVLLARRLAHHPTWTVSRLASDFAETDRRLEELGVENRSVAAAFDMSYRDLLPEVQRLFRRLGLHPGAELDAHAVAALDDIPLPQAHAALESLYNDHLLEEGTQGRFHFHDLLCEFSRTLGTRDTAEDRARSIERLLNYYEFTAACATREVAARHHLRLDVDTSPSAVPTLTSRGKALGWLRTELTNLLACVDMALALAEHTHVVRMASAMAVYLRLEGPWPKADAVSSMAVSSARCLGDRGVEADALVELARIRLLMCKRSSCRDLLGEAMALYTDMGDRLGVAITSHELGTAAREEGNYPEAEEHLYRGLVGFRAVGREGYPWESAALTGLGRVSGMMDRHTEAVGLLLPALISCRLVCDRNGEASVLRELGRVYALMSKFNESIGLQKKALTLYEIHGSRQEQAGTLLTLGTPLFNTGKFQEATLLAKRSLALFMEQGSLYGQAAALLELGRIREVAGEYAASASLHKQALDLYRSIGSRQGEANARNELGRVQCWLSDYGKAGELLDQALRIYQDIGERHGEASALNDLGILHHLNGDPTKAFGPVEKSLEIARNVGHRIGEVEALVNLGGLSLRHGDADPLAALDRYTQARDTARELCTPLHEARALEGAAACYQQVGNREATLAALREAHRIYGELGLTHAASACKAVMERLR
ncbi:ATP-binding protein [Streptomyces sp. NPDC002537]